MHKRDIVWDRSQWINLLQLLLISSQTNMFASLSNFAQRDSFSVSSSLLNEKMNSSENQMPVSDAVQRKQRRWRAAWLYASKPLVLWANSKPTYWQFMGLSSTLHSLHQQMKFAQIRNWKCFKLTGEDHEMWWKALVWGKIILSKWKINK